MLSRIALTEFQHYCLLSCLFYCFVIRTHTVIIALLLESTIVSSYCFLLFFRSLVLFWPNVLSVV